MAIRPDRSAIVGRGSSSRSLWALAGAVGALLCAEAGLRPLATPPIAEWAPLSWPPGPATREVRAFGEGIAVSHFTVTRERSTGAEPDAGPTRLVILGDSYVEAVQVRDDATMGAVVEQELRRSGAGGNVVQYGWSGVDVPQYVAVAPQILTLHKPEAVVIVLTANDLGADLLTAGARLVRRPDGEWGAVVDPAAHGKGRVRAMADLFARRSSLLYLLLKRAQEVGVTFGQGGSTPAGGASMQAGGLPLPERALVALAALKEAYGEKLRILFVANVGIDGLRPATPAEEVVRAACDSLAIRCADTRAAMEADRRDSLRLSRGFLNTEPGEGHINAVGHRLAAQTILTQLLD